MVTASGLAWHAPRLPHGDRLLSFEVAYTWQSCAPDGRRLPGRRGHDRGPVRRPPVPGRARRHGTAAAGHRDRRRGGPDPGAGLHVPGHPALGAAGWPGPVRAYRRHQRPVSYFRNGTPERRTASAEEYFQVSAPHYNAGDGQPGPAVPGGPGPVAADAGNHVFYTGKLAVGPHQVSVRTANRAGSTGIRFGWQVVPLPAPLACQPRAGQPCWYPPHLAAEPPADALGLADRPDHAAAADRPARRGHLRHRRVPHHPRARSTRSRPAGRRARWRTRRPSATWTWPGRTTARTPARRRGAATSRPPRSATCTSATPRSGGWTSASWTRSSRCSASGSACARGRGSTRSSWTTSTASTRRPPPGSGSPPATRRTSWPTRST